ncbi:MAG: hypothetical protein WBQ34_09145 [Candidatus Acidiferrales bacterium]
MRYSLNGLPNRWLACAALLAFALLVIAFNAYAKELEKETIAAFNHYVEVAEQQTQSTLRADGPFLWIDGRPPSTRKDLYSELRAGQFVIRRLDTYDDGRPIKIPNGMVHHWIGIAFVPGATLKSAEAVLEDYQDYSRIYSPQVRRSQVSALAGGAFSLHLQLYRGSPRSVSYNADFKVRRVSLSPTRIASSSISTRIAQLRDPSQPDGAEFPVGQDSGYLWRLNDYWRYEEKDGGVFMQVESISLSRDVPTLLAWIAKPIIHRIARETIANLLEANRRAIENPRQYAPHTPGIPADSAAAPEREPNR